jgi:nicotinamidase-related amidase
MSGASEELARLVDPRQAAVVVIDMQNDFCRPDLFANMEQVMARLRALIAEARRLGVRLVFCRVLHDETTDSPVWTSRYAARPYRRSICRTGTPGADYHPDFRPEPGDLEVIKHRYSAFVGTDLELKLRALGIRTLVMTGTATNICVESTLRDGFQRDFYIVLVDDCCGTDAEALHQGTLANVRSNFGLVASSDEVIQAWQAVAAPV